jgi:hypothetical protein
VFAMNTFIKRLLAVSDPTKMKVAFFISDPCIILTANIILLVIFPSLLLL